MPDNPYESPQIVEIAARQLNSPSETTAASSTPEPLSFLYYLYSASTKALLVFLLLFGVFFLIAGVAIVGTELYSHGIGGVVAKFELRTFLAILIFIGVWLGVALIYTIVFGPVIALLRWYSVNRRHRRSLSQTTPESAP